MIYKKAKPDLFFKLIFVFLSLFASFTFSLDDHNFLVPAERSAMTLYESLAAALNVAFYTMSYVEDCVKKKLVFDQQAHILLDASIGNSAYAIWCLNQIVHGSLVPESSFLIICRTKINELSQLFDNISLPDNELQQKVQYLRSLVDYIKRGLFILTEQLYPSVITLPNEI